MKIKAFAVLSIALSLADSVERLKYRYVASIYQSIAVRKPFRLQPSTDPGGDRCGSGLFNVEIKFDESNFMFLDIYQDAS